MNPWPGAATPRIWQKSGISARPKKEPESGRNRITARSPSRNCFFLPQAVYCARRESNLDICLRRAIGPVLGPPSRLAFFHRFSSRNRFERGCKDLHGQTPVVGANWHKSGINFEGGKRLLRDLAGKNVRQIPEQVNRHADEAVAHRVALRGLQIQIHRRRRVLVRAHG